MPDGFFFPEQAYPGNDPLAIARSMGLRPEEAMAMMMGQSGQMGDPMGGVGMMGMGGIPQPDYDPNLLAEMVGQQYNPYQGYPTKQVSDQVWDVMGPMDEYLLPQMYNLQNPDAGRFDLDAFFQANPTIQGPIAEAHSQAKGDPIDMYALLQSNEPIQSTNMEGETIQRPGIQDRLRQEVGRSEWADLAEQGYMPIVQAANRGASPEEMDDIAMDYYMKELEGVLAGGAPTSQRAESELDYVRQREGFRPAPGTGQPRPGFEGAGFGGGADPLADLVGSPQYGGMGGGGFGGQIVREDEGGFWVRPGASSESFDAPLKRAAELIRSGGYRQGSRGGYRRPQQDANGGGQGGRRAWWSRSGLDLARSFFSGGRSNNRGPSRSTIQSRNRRPEYGIRG